MNLGLAIFLIIIALLIGLVGGFYGARAYMKKYFQDNEGESQCISQTEFPRRAAGDDWKDDTGAVGGSERSHCEDGDARKTDRRR